jgi:hypothetical protein
MERTFVDDLKAALFVFTGAMLGYLVFTPDTSVLLGCLIGLGIGLIAVNLVRFLRQRHNP